MANLNPPHRSELIIHGGSVFLRTTHHARHICSSSIVNSSCMETSIKVSMCGTSPKVNQFITRELKIITHWLLVRPQKHHAWQVRSDKTSCKRTHQCSCMARFRCSAIIIHGSLKTSYMVHAHIAKMCHVSAVQ